MGFNQNEISKIYVGIGLDFETGGLDCTRHACTQLCLQAIRLDTFETIDRMTHYLLPYPKQDFGVSKRKVLKTRHELNASPDMMEIEDVALEYSGITMDMLRSSGVDLVFLAGEVIEFVKRNTLSQGKQCLPVMIGQNITFDIGFFQQLMNYAGKVKEFEKVFAGTKDFYGNFQPRYIDTIDLARLCFAGDPSVSSYKLELIADRLGVELDDAHDADADVTATLNVVRVCGGRLRCVSGGEGGVLLDKKEKSRVHFKI